MYESIGIAGANESVTSYSGWSTGSLYTMSGTANVIFNATPFSTTSDYPAASGNSPVVVQTQNGGTPVEWWEISNINTSCFSGLTLGLGIYKQLNASDGSTLGIEVSTDGVVYAPLSFTALPSGGGTTGWYYRTLGAIPSATNLRIRFTNNSVVAGDNYRFDDILLSGTLLSASTVSFAKDTVYGCASAKLLALTEGDKKSIRFDGTDDYLTVPAATYFSGDFTVEAWVNVKSDRYYHRLIDFGNGTNADNVYISLSNANSGRITFAIYQGATATTLSATAKLPLNQWVHVACVLSGTTGTIYLNGEAITSGTLSIPNNVVRNNCYIGRSNWVGDEYVQADIDELRIWNVARTAGDIQANMETQVTLAASGLTHYWKMDEGAGATTADDKGGSTATFQNGPAWINSSAPLNVNYTWSPTTGLSAATGRTVIASPVANTLYTVTADNPSGCTSSSEVVVIPSNPPGDPDVFGNGFWNASAFYGGVYLGYYSESVLSFFTGNKYVDRLSPSDAPDYKGCYVPDENHSMSYKRASFPEDIYEIRVELNDDTATLIIDGVPKWGRNYSLTPVVAWIGKLDASSEVEFKWREFLGRSQSQLTFTVISQPVLVPGTIAGGETLCYNGDPAAFTSTLSATGCSGVSYQWQSSPDNSTWTDIAGATALTYDPGNVTDTTYYRRSVRDDCRAIAYSNVITVAVSDPAPPAVTGASNCGTGTVDLSASGSPATYNWYDVSSGGSSLSTTSGYTTPSINSTTDYYVTSVAADGCESSVRTTVTATILPVPAAPAGTGDTVCVSGNAALSASGSPSGYRWYDDPAAGSLLHSASSFSPFIDSDTVFYVSAEEAGCESSRVLVEARVSSFSEGGTLSGTQTLCSGNNGGTISLGGYAGTIVSWEISLDNFSSDINDLGHTADQYTYTDLVQSSSYRVIVKSGVCPEDTSTLVLLTIESPPNPGLLEGDTTVASGLNSGDLSLSGHTGSILRWESSTDNFASVAMIFNTTPDFSYNNLTSSTKYRVVIQSGVCPEVFSNIVTVNVSNPIVLVADTVYTTMNINYMSGISVLTNDAIGTSFELQTVNAAATVNNGVVSLDALGNILYTPPADYTGTDQFTYVVCDIATSTTCITAPLIFIVKDTLIIYSSMTPNGDGINDTWIIDGIDLYPDNRVKIFNRWGDLVYEEKNYNNRDKVWTGTANSGFVPAGKELPDGTYFYSIDLGKGDKPRSGYMIIKH